MEIHGIHTGTLQAGDDIAAILLDNYTFADSDIVTVSSKAIATVEGAAIHLPSVDVRDAARAWAEKHDRNPAFRQAVLQELERLNGKILDEDSRYMRSEVQPDGMTEGVILTAAAGLDESNIQPEYAIGWPHHPVESAQKIQQKILQHTHCRVGVLVSDSCLLPRRLGVIAQALVAVGFDPIASHIGKPDIYGRPLTVTNEAIADQIATAANFVMGNADQAIPAAVARDTGIALSSFAGWVPGIAPEEDLFRGLL